MTYGTPKKSRPEIENSTKDLLASIACRQYDTAERFQKPIFDEALKNEEMLYNKEVPALKGRSNVPFDSLMMNGYVETVLSNTDEPVTIAFENQREEALKASKKMTEVWRVESAPDKEDWNTKSLDSKRECMIFGTGFFKLYVESLPKFRTCLDVIDGYDMLTEPQGGANLDKHLFKGQRNIFRTSSDLDEMAKSGVYDAVQVAKLKRAYTEDDFKKTLDSYHFKDNRLKALGLSITNEDFVGDQMYSLCEWVMYYKGDWYHMVFSKLTGTWLRVNYLEDVFAHAEKYAGRGAWVAWHATRDPFVFWSRAPLSDIRPVAYTMKKVVNYALDNLEKKNWNQRAYDSEMFKDPTQFLYKQDGLVKADIPAGKNIQNGIYEFQIPDTSTVTVNMIEFLNGFVGQKTGVTSDLEGSSGQDKVGIYYGNLEQSSNRMGLKNKMYSQAYTDLGVMFDYGVWEHLREPYAVKLIGLQGVEWDEALERADTDHDFNIIVTGGSDEAKRNEAQNQRKQAALESIESNQLLSGKVNPNWLIRQKLTMSGWSEDDVRQALDSINDADAELLSEAAMAIADVVQGEMPKMNRGATTAWAQKILDFIYDNEVTIEQFTILKNYVDAHMDIIRDNMIRKARTVIAQQGVDPRAVAADGSVDPSLMPAMDAGRGAPVETIQPKPAVMA